MGDIVLYDQTLQMERLWVPEAEKRYWLRFYRRQGYIALSLKQWRKLGERPYRTPRGNIDRLAEARKMAET